MARAPKTTAGTGHETSGAVTCLLVRYVRELGGDDAVRRVVARSGVAHDISELCDESAWFSYEERIALWEAAADVLDDPHATLHMGERALEFRIGRPVTAVAAALGSPRTALANAGRVTARFNTAGRVRTLALHRNRATTAYELHSEFVPNRLDCEFNVGLLRAVGPLFGRPPLEVEHRECQVLGAPSCLYHVRWPSRRLARRRRRDSRYAALEARVESLAWQLQSLQTTVADVVGADGVDTVLRRLVRRAADAVRAPRHLLAVYIDGGEPNIIADGFGDGDDIDALAVDLLARGSSASSASRLVHRIASPRASYGVLAAFFDEHGFLESEDALLSAYARVAAAAIENAQLVERVKHNALHDDLTGLANRRNFEEQCAIALARARRSNQEIAVLFIDLDGFKDVNDDDGHAVGDAVLTAVASRLRQHLRAGDVPARFGGDEFTALLVDADASVATMVAERLRAVIEKPIRVGPSSARVSASIGIATSTDAGTDVVKLIQAADAAMYDAKRGGRNLCALHLPFGASELVRQSA